LAAAEIALQFTLDHAAVQASHMTAAVAHPHDRGILLYNEDFYGPHQMGAVNRVITQGTPYFARAQRRRASCRQLARRLAGRLRWVRFLWYWLGVAAVSDLTSLGAPVADAIGTARFIATLALTGQQKARLLREYLRETRLRLSNEVLIAARDYSFYL
jgi:hypothetical protein